MKELIQAQEKAELILIEEFIGNLEKELADLRKRDAELEKLSHTDDHIHFLQVKLLYRLSDTDISIGLPVPGL